MWLPERCCRHREIGGVPRFREVMMANNKYFWILIGFILIMQIPIFLMMK